MDVARKTFPSGLPTLEQLAAYNKGRDVIEETSWIWGKDDEVLGPGSLPKSSAYSFRLAVSIS